MWGVTRSRSGHAKRKKASDVLAIATMLWREYTKGSLGFRVVAAPLAIAVVDLVILAIMSLPWSTFR